MSDDRAELEIREATAEDIADVMSIIDAAMLSMSTDRVRSLIKSWGDGKDDATGHDGTILLAVEDGRTLGTLVLDDREVEAIAVRQRRRDQDVGSALIEAASERVDGALIASFDAHVLPFYERLGFEIEAVDGDGFAGEDRYRGLLRDDSVR